MKMTVYFLLFIIVFGLRILPLRLQVFHNVVVVDVMKQDRSLDIVFEKLSGLANWGYVKAYSTAGKQASLLSMNIEAIQYYEMLHKNGIVLNQVDWFFFAQSLTANREYARALDSYLMIPNSNFLCKNGMSLALSGEVAFGLELCNKAIERFGSSQVEINNLVNIHLTRGDRSTAIEILTFFVERLSEDDVDYWWARGKQYEVLEDWSLSADAYGHAAKLSNTPFDYFFLQGQMFEKDEAWVSAKAAYLNAYALKPDSLKVNLAIGSVLRRLGEYDNAVQWYESMREYFHHGNVVELYLGITYQEQGELDLAYDWYSKALDKNPEDAMVMYSLARTLYDLGQIETAIVFLSEAVDIRPDQSQWRQLLEDWLSKH